MDHCFLVASRSLPINTPLHFSNSCCNPYHSETVIGGSLGGSLDIYTGFKGVKEPKHDFCTLPYPDVYRVAELSLWLTSHSQEVRDMFPFIS